MNASGQKGTDGEHHTASGEAQANLGDHSGDTVFLDDEIGHSLLKQRQVWLILQCLSDRLLIEGTIGLGPRRSDRWPLARIQHPKMNAGLIRRPGHHTAQGIDFLDQMSLANSANSGIAAHLPERFNILRQQQGSAPQARGCQRSLRPGMTAPHDNDVKRIRKPHEKP